MPLILGIAKYLSHYVDSCVYVCGDIPSAEFVVWSLFGINLPSLSPESQSQYTPDSAGGLFTQPHKSISKSQKPVSDYTEVHTVSKPNIDAHTENNLLVKHTHFRLSSIFFFNAKVCSLLWPLTWWGAAPIQDSEVINGNISPWSRPDYRLKNHLVIRMTNSNL